MTSARHGLVLSSALLCSACGRGESDDKPEPGDTADTLGPWGGAAHGVLPGWPWGLSGHPDTSGGASGETSRDTSSGRGDTATPDSGKATDSDIESAGPFDTAADTAGGDGAGSWMAGDDIPGWDDYPCEVEAGAGTVEVEFPTMDRTLGYAGAPLGGPGKFGVGVVLADCEELSCGAGSPEGHTTWASASAQEWRPTLPARGMGWYVDGVASPGREASGHGALPYGQWTSTLPDFRSPVRVCVSRLRPDQIAGLIEVTVHGRPFEPRWYRGARLVFRFSYTLSEHMGMYVGGTDVPSPDGNEDHLIYYYGPYDTAWPWDEITDPDIRRQVYWRYTPFNEP